MARLYGSQSEAGVVLNNPEPRSFTFEFEYSGANAIYIGKAAIGTAVGSSGWQIRKLNYDGANNVTEILWASGTNLYDKTWTARAGYAYS